MQSKNFFKSCCFFQTQNRILSPQSRTRQNMADSSSDDDVPLGQWRGKKSKSELTSAVSDGSSEKKRTRKSKSEPSDAVDPTTTLQQPSSLKQPFKQPSYSEETVPNAVYDSENNRKPTPIIFDSTSIKYMDSKNSSVISVPPIDLGVTEIERSDEFADNHQLIKASSIQAAAMLEHGEFRYEEL
jgi:hypothetical protein